MNQSSCTVAFLLLGGLLFVAGCGRSAASVHGTVRYEDQPVDDGWITFMPADGKAREAGGQITGGKYRIAEITPGEKVVQIIGVKEVPFVASSEEMERLSRENPQSGAGQDLVHPADDIPPDAVGNNQRVVIQQGDQTLDFQLYRP